MRTEPYCTDCDDLDACKGNECHFWQSVWPVWDRSSGDAPDRWIVFYGMWCAVCSVCGGPVEDDPCRVHQPDAYALCVGGG